MAIHDFSTKLMESKETSKLLDSFFSRYFFIMPTPLELDKLGVDRIFVDRQTMQSYTVEYKQDSRCNETGNAFIEICSVNRDGVCEKKGWAHTCTADKLLYHDVVGCKVYIFNMQTIRDSLCEWDDYRRAHAYNNGYYGVGILVPIDVLSKQAIKTMEINT